MLPILVLGLIGGGLFLYGLYRLWKVIDILRRRSASASWMLTTGKVCDWKTGYHRDSDTDDHFYAPEITYGYTVMGEEFKNTISLKWEPSIGSVENTIAEFGDGLEVYYNPEKPKEHICSEEKVNLMDVFTAVVFLPFGLVFLRWALFIIR